MRLWHDTSLGARAARVGQKLQHTGKEIHKLMYALLRVARGSKYNHPGSKFRYINKLRDAP